MTAYNVVRMRVKPGKNDEYIAAHKALGREAFPGMRSFSIIKTGERDYCLIGEWDSMDAIVAARPAMIATLDTARTLLEDLGGGLGVTDPVSGEVVLETHPEPA
ncbi:MAG: antibiotic biosynthesis monooxygenase [Amaricoccus sp.]